MIAPLPIPENSGAIGVDVGGTKIEVAAVDARGEVRRRVRRPTDVPGGPAGVIREMIAAIRELQEAADLTPVAIGVGIAGQIEPGSGAVRFAPNLAWRDVPLRAELAARLSLPIVVVNALNPSRLILGGGVADGLPGLLDAVSREIRERALPNARQDLQVLPAGLQKDAVAIGAAALAYDQLDKSSGRTTVQGIRQEGKEKGEPYGTSGDQRIGKDRQGDLEDRSGHAGTGVGGGQ